MVGILWEKCYVEAPYRVRIDTGYDGKIPAGWYLPLQSYMQQIFKGAVKFDLPCRKEYLITQKLHWKRRLQAVKPIRIRLKMPETTDKLRSVGETSFFPDSFCFNLFLI